MENTGRYRFRVKAANGMQQQSEIFELPRDSVDVVAASAEQDNLDVVAVPQEQDSMEPFVPT